MPVEEEEVVTEIDVLFGEGEVSSSSSRRVVPLLPKLILIFGLFSPGSDSKELSLRFSKSRRGILRV